MLCTHTASTLTVLPHIHTDVLHRGKVGDGRLHCGTCGPHVVEEEDRHSGEAEDAQPSQAQNVGQEHKLKPEKKISFRN